jgi:hypothetical protein
VVGTRESHFRSPMVHYGRPRGFRYSKRAVGTQESHVSVLVMGYGRVSEPTCNKCSPQMAVSRSQFFYSTLDFIPCMRAVVSANRRATNVRLRWRCHDRNSFIQHSISFLVCARLCQRTDLQQLFTSDGGVRIANIILNIRFHSMLTNIHLRWRCHDNKHYIKNSTSFYTCAR